MPAVSDQDWLTATDASKRLHMTNWELWRAAAVSRIKAVEFGETVRFSRASVEKAAKIRADELQAAAAELAQSAPPPARRRAAAGKG
jgi:hypothetical protein